ncbi:hypothetical protein C1645_738603 [Glomus cerebriforme]|uniref:Galactose oxidase n=1 Tax=Glomus cerebriforme TaxID=658196 RepID=A0A397SZP3_9GLOM|nr:hypothetical protein C1645_738603 [Glomus cerebriforme]
MVQNSLTSIILWILFQLLIEVNCQMTPFNPKQRFIHTATLINNKLYISGGRNDNDVNAGKFIVNKEFFYLDVSVAFNTQNLSWVDLTSTSPVPIHSASTAVKGGANNNTLFIIGGITDKPIVLVYTFDTQTNLWSNPKIGGIARNKSTMTGIIDHNGKVYLLNGADTLTVKDVIDMLILDTINLKWGKGSIVGASSASETYGAIYLISNNSIIYFGGYTNLSGGKSDFGGEIPLDQLFIYNTISDSWSTQIAKGKIPSSRDGFSSILGLDGQKVIIFGGTSFAGSQSVPREESLYELNLSTLEWYIPKVSETSQFPSSRVYHQANVIGKYMVISFGAGYDPLTESHILLLDISNNDEYIWTNNFDLTSSNLATVTVTSIKTTATNVINIPNTQQSGRTLSNNKLIGAIVGSLIGGSLLTIGSFFIYKWNKNKRARNNIIKIPGS